MKRSNGTGIRFAVVPFVLLLFVSSGAGAEALDDSTRAAVSNNRDDGRQTARRDETAGGHGAAALTRPGDAPPAQDESVPGAVDTTEAGRRRSYAIGWSAVYHNLIELEKSSALLPYNDEEALSHINDRLVFMLQYRPIGSVELFLKGATGHRKVEGDIYRSRFSLDQGHFAYSWRSLLARLFLREQVYRSGSRLIEFVSWQSALLEGRGKGLYLEAGDGSRHSLIYAGAMLKGDWVFDDYGGLPTFRGGGDAFALLHGQAGLWRGCRLGLLLSSVRSQDYGDVVAIGSDLKLGWRGIDLVMELVRTQLGRWSDLEDVSLFGIDLGDYESGSLSSIFSDEVIFAAEFRGLVSRSERAGTFALVPGYRYAGCMVGNPQGEVAPGWSDAYLESWWKHPRYDIELNVDGRSRYDICEDAGTAGLRQWLRMRFRGDFEIREGCFLRESEQPSFLLSLVDEGKLARLETTLRLDDAGGGNKLSFLAEGWMNIWHKCTLQTILYLYKSESGFYSLGLEFRPSRRFLFKIAFGSFDPYNEGIMLIRSFDFYPPERERQVSIFTRIWLGDL